MRYTGKELIRRSFSRAAPTYDSSAELQAEIACELSEMLRGFGLGGVLDVGCGTGTLAALIGEKAETDSLYGLDISHEMTLEARAKLNGLCGGLISADMEQLPFDDASFDTLVSSLSYQWARDIGRCFDEALRVLKEGGRFFFATLGPATLKELNSSVEKAARECSSETLPPTLEYPDAATLQARLKDAGFGEIQYTLKAICKDYDDLFGLLRTLKRIGALNPNPGGSKTLLRGARLKKAAEIYSRDFPAVDRKGIIATYEVIFLSARKPFAS